MNNKRISILVSPDERVRTTFALLLFFLVHLCISSFNLHAGTVQQSLAQRVLDQPSKPVPVWIKVRDLEPAQSRSSRAIAAAEAEKLDRPTAYRRAISDMTRSYEDAQSGVLSELTQLESQGLAKEIKPRWIVNVVEAVLSPDEIARLASRDDVEQILLPPVIQLIAPESEATNVTGERSGSSGSISSVEPGADYVRARQAWGMGYTGKGRLVCSFDSGVQGGHNALKNSWHGKNGDTAASWFDPVNKTKTPNYFGAGIVQQHGTHTMGIMVARNGTDSIGIAPDAHWISAAVIDIVGAPILAAFEWAANPDGDLNTISDVPDVINHSWGVPETVCDNIFHDAIDNTEALGIVNIFAAGNEGGVSNAIRDPATRALDSLDCFAVGNLSLVVPVGINISSSRGPSECNGGIKPNVSAPGTSVRSTIPNNAYGQLTGTSMAAPHVSGLVALMRQKNPNATVREIKTAILNSTKRGGFNPTPVPNNSAGWGVIDCEAALNALAAPPAAGVMRIHSFASNTVTAGASVNGSVILKNQGGVTVNNLTGTVTSGNPDVTVIDGSITFGTAPAGDTVRSTDQIALEISPTAVGGMVIPLTLNLTGTGYAGSLTLYIQTEPITERQRRVIRSNRVRFTFTNHGVFGLGPLSMMPLDSVGYKFETGGNELYEAGIIIPRSATQVSTGVHSSLYEALDDFTPMPDGNIRFKSPARFGGEEARSRFTDTNATIPTGLIINQELFTAPPPNDDIVLMRYIIENPTSTNLTGTPFSIFLDWDANGQYDKNAGGYSTSDTILWTAFNTGFGLSDFRGVTFIGAPPTSALTASSSSLVYPAFSGVGANGFTLAEKYAASQSGFSTASTFISGSLDLCQVLTTTMTLPAFTGRDTIIVALVSGESNSAMTNASVRARQMLFTCCSGTTSDVNCDGSYAEIDDLTTLVDHLFITFQPLCCEAAADTDASGTIDIGDLITLVDVMFITFSSPANCP